MVAEGNEVAAAGRNGPNDRPMHRGACFGFAVRSQLAFAYLRRGDGPPLVVREGRTPPVGDQVRPLREWEPTDENPFHARLYIDDGETFRLWIRGLGWYAIAPAVPEITVPADADPVRREERLWGIPVTLCFLARGDVPLHAAAIDVDGSALLFGAPGRFGKTTLAAAFHAAGHRVLSEDVSCIRLAGEPSVVPGPAMLRLRPDSFARLELPGAVTIGRDDDRVHLALDGDDKRAADRVRLRGVVLLRGPSDAIELDREDPAEAVRDLWALSFKVPTDADRVRCFQALADLASSVPVWGLRRPMRFESLPPVIDAMIERCLP